MTHDNTSTRRRCAFLTLADPTGFVIDDDLAREPLAALGWDVQSVPWRPAAVDWSLYDAVVIRSTWDYTDDPEAFMQTLAQIERSGVPLFNSLETVRWNLRKTYLRELAALGVALVPTLWRERLQPGGLGALFTALGVDEIVVKPVVGANASGAFRLDRAGARARASEVEAWYADRALMAQPFVPAVTAEGEFSLFYFNGACSHAVLKTPKPADFRVQEEHGGEIRAINPAAALRAAGDRVMAALAARPLRALAGTPLYARVDLVRASDGSGFWLMELELIEPALYFRLATGAAARFAAALDRVVASSGRD
ncbi:MAG TPA: hypothetical protein VFG73_11080 [Rhodanobacteraceae bacterium]|nr:hypothetical protein [Rhodanobacteraceae bacterium]